MSVKISPIDVILWVLRRNAVDIIKLYDSLSPVMQIAASNDMLNFGYWTKGIAAPVDAQRALCSLVAEVAELGTSNRIADVGSGLGSPASQWESVYEQLRICCVNINFNQLAYSKTSRDKIENRLALAASSKDSSAATLDQSTSRLSFVNATSTALPFAGNSMDRVIALESAQHFRPFVSFLVESKRVLVPGGLLVVAMPVLLQKLNSVQSLFKLGVLSLTWSSEHYSFDYVKSAIQNSGYTIQSIDSIGHSVYEPLANYYIANRDTLRKKILARYPGFVEQALYRSIVKMKALSENETIGYIILKAC